MKIILMDYLANDQWSELSLNSLKFHVINLLSDLKTTIEGIRDECT